MANRYTQDEQVHRMNRYIGCPRLPPVPPVYAFSVLLSRRGGVVYGISYLYGENIFNYYFYV